MNGRTKTTSIDSSEKNGDGCAQHAIEDMTVRNSDTAHGISDVRADSLITIFQDLFSEVGIEGIGHAQTYSAHVGGNSTHQNEHQDFARNLAPLWGIKELPRSYLLENKLITP